MTIPADFDIAPCCQCCIYFTHHDDMYCEHHRFGMIFNTGICSDFLAFKGIIHKNDPREENK